jgi:hypothetical protein
MAVLAEAEVAAGLPPIELFRDVEVVPVKGIEPGGGYFGGPLWPNYDAQRAARQCRDRVPVDRAPAAVRPRSVPRTLDGPTILGGFAHLHFGHLISEFTTRLPQSLAERPDDRYLFLLDPRADKDNLPGYVWAVLEWHGVKRRQVVFADAELVVRELRVAEQGEQMHRVGPGPRYLELLEANAARRALQPVGSRVLYVTRAGLTDRGQGGQAGEAYLVSVLRGLGVSILDPERLDLRAQLALYVGAETVVFAEGSAMHCRQLLGRLEQDIVVLVRRPGTQLALAHLQARCRAVDYAQVAGRILTEQRPGRRPAAQAAGLAFYDLPALMRTFGALGINLRRVWDDGAYRAACIQDAAVWMHVRFGQGRDYQPAPTVRHARAILAAEGLGSLRIPVRFPEGPATTKDGADG